MEFVRKSNLSKKRLKLQTRETSDSGVEDFDEQVLRVWKKVAPTLLSSLSNIGLPKFGEQLRIITTKAFNAMAFIDFVINSGEKIIETYIAVYSIDYDTGVLIDNLAKEGSLGETTFLISNIRNSSYRKKEALVRERFLKNENIKLIFCGSHAKIMAFRTELNFYVIEGSANLAPNSRIEQYLFENNKEMFEFHKNWIDNIDKIATERELAVYDANGKRVAGTNDFKNYGTT